MIYMAYSLLYAVRLWHNLSKLFGHLIQWIQRFLLFCGVKRLADNVLFGVANVGNWTIAVASDIKFELDVTCQDLNNVAQVADFIAGWRSVQKG